MNVPERMQSIMTLQNKIAASTLQQINTLQNSILSLSEINDLKINIRNLLQEESRLISSKSQTDSLEASLSSLKASNKDLELSQVNLLAKISDCNEYTRKKSSKLIQNKMKLEELVKERDDTRDQADELNLNIRANSDLLKLKNEAIEELEQQLNVIDTERAKILKENKIQLNKVNEKILYLEELENKYRKSLQETEQLIIEKHKIEQRRLDSNTKFRTDNERLVSVNEDVCKICGFPKVGRVKVCRVCKIAVHLKCMVGLDCKMCNI